MKKLGAALFFTGALCYVLVNEDVSEAETTQGQVAPTIKDKITQFFQSDAERLEKIKEIQTAAINANYGKADYLLNEYEKKYGADDASKAERVRLLALTNHADEALDAIKPLLDNDPTNKNLIDIQSYALAHSMRTPNPAEGAAMAMSNGEYQKSLALYQEVLKAKPNDKAALLGIIRVELLLSDYDTAAKKLAEYKASFGEDPQYQMEQARYFAFNGNPDKAIELTKELLKKEPKNSSVLEIKAFAEAHPNTITLTANPEFTEVSPEVAQAADAMTVDNYRKAADLYQQALKKNKDDKAAILGLTRIDLFQEKYASALKRLEGYKASFGEDDNYNTERARYYALNGQSKAALDILGPLLQKDPTNDVLLDIKNYALKNKAAPTAQVAPAQAATAQATAKTKTKTAAAVPTPAPTVSPISKANKLASRAYYEEKPDLYIQSAQSYTDGGDNTKALEMIDEALGMSPDNIAYLKEKVKIGQQMDDQRVVHDTSLQLYGLIDDDEVILNLARSANRLNHLDESANYYATYTERHPDNPLAWREYAYVESWRGDDRKAMAILDHYRDLFWDTDEYLADRVRISSGAGFQTEALQTVNSVYTRIPDNYDLNYGNTTALYYKNRPIDMFASLERVNQIAPNSQETKGLNAFIKTPYRSNVSLDTYYSDDTDTVKIGRATLSGQYFTSPLTSYLVDVTGERITASIASGLNPIEGGNALDIYKFDVGVNHRLDPHLALQAKVGVADATDDHTFLIYTADAYLSVVDNFQMQLEVSRDFYDESPLSVSLGVVQELEQVIMDWQPCIECNINLVGQHASYSDDNKMRMVSLTPTAQIIGAEKFNIIMGLIGEWQSYSLQLTDGYYNPADYRYYAASTNIYFKINDDVGYEITLALGRQKDETFSSWKPANDLSAKAHIGIYRDWYLEMSAGASTRGRGIIANPTLGTYKVYSGEVKLTRRF